MNLHKPLLYSKLLIFARASCRSVYYVTRRESDSCSLWTVQSPSRCVRPSLGLFEFFRKSAPRDAAASPPNPARAAPGRSGGVSGDLWRRSLKPRRVCFPSGALFRARLTSPEAAMRKTQIDCDNNRRRNRVESITTSCRTSADFVEIRTIPDFRWTKWWLLQGAVAMLD